MSVHREALPTGRGSRKSRASALITILLSLGLALATLACGDSKNDQEKAGDLLAKGLQAHQEQKLDDAVKIYTRVLELDPNNKFAHYNLGLVDQTQGRPSKAEEHYRAALDLDSAFALALYNLGVLRAQAGATGEADALYRRAIASMPSFAEPHLNLGLLLRDQGRADEANGFLRAAVELNPSFASRVGDIPTTTTTAAGGEN